VLSKLCGVYLHQLNCNLDDNFDTSNPLISTHREWWCLYEPLSLRSRDEKDSMADSKPTADVRRVIVKAKLVRLEES
jgi:hypothetical protein